MCNIRKETWKKRGGKGKKEIYLYILFKQREGVLLFFHLGEVRKNKRSWGCGEADPQAGVLAPRLGCCVLPPTVKLLVLTIVSCNVCDFFF